MREHLRLRFGPFELIVDSRGSGVLDRWVLRCPLGSVRVHHILKSDVDRDFHDHRFDWLGLILRRGYIEHSPNAPPRVYRFLSLVRHRAEDVHRLELPWGPAWTISLTGPQRRMWGFHTAQGWVPGDVYGKDS